jgi:hypothetical protein
MWSNYLFGKASFTTGAGRTLDLWGLFDDYNYSLTPEQADHIALFLDWYATSEDLHQALKTYAAEHGAVPECVPLER